MTTPRTPPSTPISVIHEPEPGPARSRVRWGAVIAGTVTAIIVLLLLQLLMLWLGMTVIDPAEQARPFEGIGTGAAIGYLISSAIALFAGGWVAGRAANIVHSTDVVLHGVLTWAVVTLATVWFAATAVGVLLAGTVGVVGQGISLLGQGAGAVAPAVSDQVEMALEDQAAVFAEAQEEMEPLWTDPAARRQLRAVVTRILRTPGPTVTAADRQELIAVVATNTELSPAEAEATVDAWIERHDEARQALAQAEGDLREAGQAVTDAVGRASMWALLGLIVGAIIAVVGARVGAPGSRVETRAP